MKYLARFWKKFLYLAVSGSTSVFIAACYGMPANYRYLGEWDVNVRADDDQPLAGVQVSFLQYIGTDTNPDTIFTSTTDSAGSAHASIDTYEENVQHRHVAEIRDIDGDLGGGAFADTNIVWNGSSVTIVNIRKIQ